MSVNLAPVATTPTIELADSTISLAMNNRATFLASYAQYLASASADGFSANQVAEFIVARDTDNSLPGKATLNNYARAIRLGDSLAINSPETYATFAKLVTKFQNDKIDIDATFAPLKDMAPEDRRDALTDIENGENLVPKLKAASARVPAKKADKDSAALDILKAIAQATKALKSSTLTVKEFERIALAVTELGKVTHVAQKRATVSA